MKTRTSLKSPKEITESRSVPMRFLLAGAGCICLALLFSNRPEPVGDFDSTTAVKGPTKNVNSKLIMARPGYDPSYSRAILSATNALPLTSPPQLVKEMINLGTFREGITQAQADKFKENVQKLVEQGDASVPTIEDFLTKNVDTDYGDLKGGEQLGYSSLRAAMLDTLNQIGGPQAEAAMVQTLQSSATPAEVLELAKNLEGQAPGQYRDQILKAAREVVDMSSANQLGNNVEVGPAFHVLETFGNAKAQNGGNGVNQSDPK